MKRVLMVVYIHVFVPQSFGVYPLRSKHVYFDKQYRPIELPGAVKTQKKICNTKTLNLSEHRSVSVCARSPALAILFLSLASTAAFNKSLVCSFFHLASFGFFPFLSVLWTCCSVSVTFSIFPILFTTGGFFLKSFTVFPTLHSSHLKLD